MLVLGRHCSIDDLKKLEATITNNVGLRAAMRPDGALKLDDQLVMTRQVCFFLSRHSVSKERITYLHALGMLVTLTSTKNAPTCVIVAQHMDDVFEVVKNSTWAQVWQCIHEAYVKILYHLTAHANLYPDVMRKAFHDYRLWIWQTCKRDRFRKKIVETWVRALDRVTRAVPDAVPVSDVEAIVNAALALTVAIDVAIVIVRVVETMTTDTLPYFATKDFLTWAERVIETVKDPTFTRAVVRALTQKTAREKIASMSDVTLTETAERYLNHYKARSLATVPSPQVPPTKPWWKFW
jgi:hypothetical protein